jgi:anaerobic magnesium-protoporphyrin IX monomethyl ester cyclase
MNICLIRPPQLVTKSNIGNKAAAPIGIAFLASVLEKHGHKVTLIDGIAEAPESLSFFIDGAFVNGLKSEELIKFIPSNVDVIGFSLMFTMNWLHDRELIAKTRLAFPNVLIIAGGEHITALPEFSIKQSKGIDICVLGEGEQTIVELIDAYEKKQTFDNVSGIVYKKDDEYLKTTKRTRQINISELPWPSWSFLPTDKYFEHSMVFGVDRGRCLPIVASRGCPYKCTFCSSPDMWGTRYVLRTEKDVVDEIDFLYREYQVQNIDFYDLTAIVKRDWIIRFCKELIERKIDITWQLPSGTRSEAIDKEVADLMYQSGCRNVTYAPETGSKELLRAIMKKVKLKSLLLSAKHSIKAGLNVKVNIIIGLPGESHKDIWKTIFFLINCSWVGVHDTTPGLFYPYPGSKIFNDFVNEGIISLDDDIYLTRLLFTDEISRNYSYNSNMSIKWIRVYQILFLMVFYGTNYLFRPIRFFRTVRNIATSKYESRFEMTFSDLLKGNKLSKKKSLAM